MFRPPVFNLLCNVWRGNPAPPPAGPPDVAGQLCQLSWDDLGNQWQFNAIAPTPRRFMKLSVPFRTDLRGPLAAGGPDLVECPAGSGRFYSIQGVDDVARGFANEYRAALAELVACPTPLP